MKRLLLLPVLILAFGCTGKPTPIPEMGSSNASLYAAKCGTCHSVPHPKRHTFEQWEHMLTIMEKQMEHRKMQPLTSEEKTTIVGYLKKHAR